MTDQEALNRRFEQCLATNTATVEHCMLNIGELKKDVQEASSEINRSLNRQGIQLERIENKLEGLEKMEDDMYGRGNTAGLLARTQRLEQLHNDGEGVFVTKSEFDPIKKLVYGAVALVIIAVATSLISLVVHTK